MSNSLNHLLDDLTGAVNRIFTAGEGKPNDVDLASERKVLCELNASGRLYSAGDLTKLDTGEKVADDTELLIDCTEYGKDEDPKTVSNDRKVFRAYKKSADGKSYLGAPESFRELIDEQQPGGSYAHREEPKLGFFGWLRHKLSFIFGEPEEYKQYDRWKKATEEKKKDLFQKKYNFPGMEIDKNLADENMVDNYIRNGIAGLTLSGTQHQNTVNEVKVTVNQNQVPKKNEPVDEKKQSTINREKMEQEEKQRLRDIRCNSMLSYFATIDGDDARLVDKVNDSQAKKGIRILTNVLYHKKEDERVDKVLDYLTVLSAGNYVFPKDNDKMMRLFRAIGAGKKDMQMNEVLDKAVNADQLDSPFHEAHQLLTQNKIKEKPANAEEMNKDNVNKDNVNKGNGMEKIS